MRHRRASPAHHIDGGGECGECELAADLPAAPAQLKIPVKLPAFVQRGGPTIAQQITHGMEVACVEKAAAGWVAYSPIREWTPERRKAAGMNANKEGTRITKACKVYLYLHVHRQEDPGEVTLGWDKLRGETESEEAGITTANMPAPHKFFWEWAAAVATSRVQS